MFVVDDDGSRKNAQESAFGFDEFMAALAEEQAKHAEFFGDSQPQAAEAETGDLDVTENRAPQGARECPMMPHVHPMSCGSLKPTIKQVRLSHGAVNWALFALR